MPKQFHLPIHRLPIEDPAARIRRSSVLSPIGTPSALVGLVLEPGNLKSEYRLRFSYSDRSGRLLSNLRARDLDLSIDPRVPILGLETIEDPVLMETVRVVTSRTLATRRLFITGDGILSWPSPNDVLESLSAWGPINSDIIRRHFALVLPPAITAHERLRLADTAPGFLDFLNQEITDYPFSDPWDQFELVFPKITGMPVSP